MSPSAAPISTNAPRGSSSAYGHEFLDRIVFRENGSISQISRIFPSRDKKPMDREIEVFFIQKDKWSSCSKTKSIPSLAPMDFRFMRPRAFS